MSCFLALVNPMRRCASANSRLIIGNIQDSCGSGADDLLGPVVQATKLIAKHFPGLTIACDVCLCAYTSHGHCGGISIGIDLLLSMPRRSPNDRWSHRQSRLREATGGSVSGLCRGRLASLFVLGVSGMTCCRLPHNRSQRLHGRPRQSDQGGAEQWRSQGSRSSHVLLGEVRVELLWAVPVGCTISTGIRR